MRSYFAPLLMLLMLAGCGSSNMDNSVSGQQQGTLQIFLTDKPIQAKEVWVTFSRIDVHSTGDAWQSVSTKPVEVDLLTLKNTESLIASANLKDGSYTGVRVLVDKGNVVFQDGSSCDLKVPSSEVSVPVNFTIQNGKITKLVFDFDAGQSVHVVEAGKSEKCVLRPVIVPVE